MKTMLALLISFTLSYPTALAGDAPLRTGEGDALATLDSTPVLFIAPIAKGEASPVDGRVLDAPSYIAVAQRIASAEAERDALKAAPQNVNGGAWLAFLLLGAVVAGVGLGWGIRGALAPK